MRSRLIQILSSPMQVSDHIKISLKRCFPKQFESFLRVRIFCDLKRFLVLRVSHISQLLIICIPHQQIVNDLSMPVIRSIMKSRPRSEVQSINISARVEKDLNGFEVAFL